MKTYSAKTNEIEAKWHLIDANNMILGRLAVTIATLLRGKHKPEYTSHVDTGDMVVIINAEKIAVTGNKMKDKIYYKHSGFPGGLTKTTLSDLKAAKPCLPIIKAVKGMLPKGPLGSAMLKKLKVYSGDTHPHAAQQPKLLTLVNK